MIHWHLWKDHLELWKMAKFESHTFINSEDITLQSLRILQRVVWKTCKHGIEIKLLWNHFDLKTWFNPILHLATGGRGGGFESASTDFQTFLTYPSRLNRVDFYQMSSVLQTTCLMLAICLPCNVSKLSPLRNLQ